MSQFEAIHQAVAFPVVQAIHGEQVVYTPTGLSSITITASFNEQDQEVGQQGVGRERRRIGRLVITKSDHPGKPEQPELVLIRGSIWIVDSIINDEGGSYELEVVRTETLEHSSTEYRMGR